MFQFLFGDFKNPWPFAQIFDFSVEVGTDFDRIASFLISTHANIAETEYVSLAEKFLSGIESSATAGVVGDCGICSHIGIIFECNVRCETISK